MKQSKLLLITFLVFAAACLTSCEGTIFESEKTYNLNVLTVNRDTVFLINNRKQPAFIRISFEGELSHEATILWSIDSLFTRSTEISVPSGKFSVPENQADHYSSKVYLKYKSLNDSTSGRLHIKVKI